MSTRKTPEHVIILSETESETLFNMAELENLLKPLNTLERKVIIMHLQSYNLDEISRELNLSQPAIIAIIHKHHRQLKKPKTIR